jgi:4a-hydroxytetrahydrobiopterin dehydratase
LLSEIDPDWRLNIAGHLERDFTFPDFARALGFANAIGDIAESEGHHPDLHVGWGKCTVEIWTHKVSGLTKSDFVLAAKTDRCFEKETAKS